MEPASTTAVTASKERWAYRVHDLELRRGEVRLLARARLSIEAGRATAVVGANGAGKSTLLKFLGFLLPMSCAEFEFFDTPVRPGDAQWQRLRRQTTYVAQSPFLFRGTVWENVAYGLVARGRVDRRRVEEALARVGLSALARRNAQRLSGGEAQRVAWARALAIDPPVYLLDEPTANADREFAAVAEEIVRELVSRGRTVVFSTHSPAQAYRLASRILSFRGGQLLPFPVLNVWQSKVVAVSGDLAELAAGNVRIWWAGNARRGETCEVTVDPESVLLAREPVHSSARNCLPGRITRLEGDEAALLVVVDCGIPVAARLTAAAARELQLAVGAPVYVVFKASAVHRVADAIENGPCSLDTRGNENGEDS